MTTSRLTNRKKTAFIGVALTLAVAAVSPRVGAQTPEELNAARALFSEAYKDEQEKRFSEALEKFQRVAKVRESASVRYRIGTCLMELGRLREARDTFRALASTTESLEPKDKPIAESAAEKALSVDRRIPRLTVKLPADAPTDARVTVDGAAVPTGRPLELDPGDHLVNATATGMKPFEGRVKLTEGATPYDVTFSPAAESVKVDTRKPNHTLAYVAIGGGAALAITGVALLLVREGTISDIETACPNGVCPTSQQSDIESKRDQASLFGPLGIGLGAVGLAAAGFGTYLLLKPSSSASPTPGTASPTSSSARALRVGPHFVQGGAILRVGATF